MANLKQNETIQTHECLILHTHDVTPGFKDKAECTPYVSPGNQTSHIATNEGAVSIHNA